MLGIENLHAAVADKPLLKARRKRSSLSIRLAALAAVGTVAFLGSVPAAAADTQDAVLPFLMRYRLCAHSGPAELEAIQARCGAERERLIKDAAPIIDRFYPSAGLTAKRRLVVTLSAIDDAAARLGRKGEPYGPLVLRYTSCLAENALADPKYLSGKVLVGWPIEKKCRTVYNESMKNLEKGAAGRRAKERLWWLKTDFSKLYVIPLTGMDALPPWVGID